jgi:DNA-binding Lrp family transcriptional regulator
VKKCLYKLLYTERLFQGVILQKNESLDPIDCRILSLLQQDCRLSFSKVAEKTHVSVGTAYNRVKSLEAKGFVKGYSLLLDSVKLGYTLAAVIFVQADGNYLTAAESEIARAENVLAVYDVTGEFDAVVIAKFKNREELNVFIKHLASAPYVKRTSTSVSLNVGKEDFRVNLPEMDIPEVEKDK